jgi:hypothetical protein
MQVVQGLLVLSWGFARQERVYIHYRCVRGYSKYQVVLLKDELYSRITRAEMDSNKL